MSDDENKKDIDWYQILHIKPTATDKEIKKGYRNRALIDHPDKNKKDSPEEAAKKFHLINKAQEILLDKEKRAKFDGTLKAKALKRKRKVETDVKLSNLRDVLNAKEREFKKRKKEEAKAKANTVAEMEHLRREGKKKREEQERKNEEKRHKATRLQKEDLAMGATIKVRWDENKWRYSQQDLEFIFAKCGTVDHVLLGSRKAPNTKSHTKTALVSFADVESARMAMGSKELKNKFSLEWATGKEPVLSNPYVDSTQSDVYYFSTNMPNVPASEFSFMQPKTDQQRMKEVEMEHQNLEEMILKKMKEAAQKQKETEQQQPAQETKNINTNSAKHCSSNQPHQANGNHNNRDNESLIDFEVRQMAEKERLKQQIIEEV